MWYFQLVADPDTKFLILPGREYVLGRRDCDIVIENDPSVSRKHAILKVSHPDINVPHPEKRPTITLKDISKFGTHVNGVKICGALELHDGDEVKFGTPKSIHRVAYHPFVVTTSCVDGQGKREVRGVMGKVGGHVTSEWQKDCSLLVMKTITVTVKVVCALVAQKHIVTPPFLRAYYQHLTNGGEKPDPASFQPPVTERLSDPDVSFLPNPSRACVFQGMSFYFLCSSQFGKMNLAVELGGGVPILCDDPGSADLHSLIQDKTVVMTAPSSSPHNKMQKEWIEQVQSHLKRNKKRSIQDAEIGYAVLYCSTTEYCNPRKDVSHLLSAPMASQSLSQVGTMSMSSQIILSAASHRIPELPPKSATPAAQSASNQVQTKLRVSKPVHKTEEEASSQQKSSSVDQSIVSMATADRNASSQVNSGTLKARIKEEPATPGKSHSDAAADDGCRSSSSGTALNIQPSAPGEVVVKGCPTRARSRSPAPKETGSLNKRQTRSRPMSPAPENSDLIEKRQTRSRSPAPESVGHTGKRQTRSQPQSMQKVDAVIPQSRSRSPVNRKVNIPDTETSPSASISDVNNKGQGQREEGVVKTEKCHAAGGASSSHTRSATYSEALFDSDEESAGTSRQQPRNRINLLDDSDEEITVGRKPAPAKKKRPLAADSDGDEDDPFDFLKKRQKRSPSPWSTSPSPNREEQDSNKNESKNGVSAGQKAKDFLSDSGNGLAQESAAVDSSPEPPYSIVTKCSPPDPSPIRPSGRSVTRDVSDSASIPVPRGYLTTRVPIKDQAVATPGFEPEDIKSSAVIVQFDNLIKQPATAAPEREDQSDVPEGMTRWKGALVPNFKSFRKVLPAGAEQLPRIIGGRDLEEYCRQTRKEMDDWLQEMQQAESQSTQQDRAALQMFDYQPIVASKGLKRR